MTNSHETAERIVKEQNTGGMCIRHDSTHHVWNCEKEWISAIESALTQAHEEGRKKMSSEWRKALFEKGFILEEEEKVDLLPSQILSIVMKGLCNGVLQARGEEREGAIKVALEHEKIHSSGPPCCGEEIAQKIRGLE